MTVSGIVMQVSSPLSLPDSPGGDGGGGDRLALGQLIQPEVAEVVYDMGGFCSVGEVGMKVWLSSSKF